MDRVHTLVWVEVGDAPVACNIAQKARTVTLPYLCRTKICVALPCDPVKYACAERDTPQDRMKACRARLCSKAIGSQACGLIMMIRVNLQLKLSMLI